MGEGREVSVRKRARVPVRGRHIAVSYLETPPSFLPRPAPSGSASLSSSLDIPSIYPSFPLRPPHHGHPPRNSLFVRPSRLAIRDVERHRGCALSGWQEDRRGLVWCRLRGYGSASWHGAGRLTSSVQAPTSSTTNPSPSSLYVAWNIVRLCCPHSRPRNLGNRRHRNSEMSIGRIGHSTELVCLLMLGPHSVLTSLFSRRPPSTLLRSGGLAQCPRHRPARPEP